jgi:hypothetical protein
MRIVNANGSTADLVEVPVRTKGDSALLIPAPSGPRARARIMESNAVVGVDDAILGQQQADELGDRLLELLLGARLL